MQHQLINFFLYITIALCVYSQGAFAYGDKWKFVIYMQADNDLFEYAKIDLLEISDSIKNEQKTEAIVLLDTPGDKGKRIYHFSNNGKELIKTLPESTTQESDLKSLLSIAAKIEGKTIFTIWGHGEGWSSNELAQFGGVALDDFPQSKLTISQIAKVLNEYGRPNILAIDACLMQTIEVAYELRETSQFISGSSQIQNYEGFTYDKLINYMNTDLEREAKMYSASEEFILSKKMIDINNLYALDSKSTLSVISSSELENILLPRFNRSFGKLADKFEKDFSYKLIFDISSLPSFLGESKDLNASVEYIIKFLVDYDLDKELLKEFKELSYSIKRTVLNYKYGESYVLDNRYFLGSFRAFGIWFPTSKINYATRIKDFKKSSFFKMNPNWPRFLASLYSQKLILL